MRLDGFDDMTVLGQGGFGTVYRARRSVVGDLVAVKMLSLPTDENIRAFVRERNLLHQQIRNRHVVTLLAWDLDHQHPHIVLEYCTHGSLRRFVGKLPVFVVARALEHAATGLKGLHDQGGWHRDIKPDNLLVTDDAGKIVVKLGDLGLARTPFVSTSPMTFNGAGTLGYIAPEIMNGAPYDARADIYSLGVTIAELVTGTTDLDAVSAIPQPLRGLIQHMVSKKPSERPTVDEVLAHPAVAVPAGGAKKPPASKPVAAAQKMAPTQDVEEPGLPWWVKALGVVALAAGAAAASANTRDANGRYHRSDGTYARGPFDW